ncbi:MAG: hypothetical protein R3343_13755 [Nitriliruptorales bacterium]|nr:hypothetical protein [Nitriliruptorales bacterium]
MSPDTLVGADTDGDHRVHLMVVRGETWRTACGTPLPDRWLPHLGGAVTCGSCRRTVAYRSMENDLPERQAQPDPFGYRRFAELLARSGAVRARAEELRDHRRLLSEQAAAARRRCDESMGRFREVKPGS